PEPALRAARAGPTRSIGKGRPRDPTEREGHTAGRVPPLVGRKGPRVHPIPPDAAASAARPRRRGPACRGLPWRTLARGGRWRGAVVPRGPTGVPEHGGRRRGPEPAVRAVGRLLGS